MTAWGHDGARGRPTHCQHHQDAVDGRRSGGESGHPGAPMGLADVATVSSRHLVVDPTAPEFVDRDRFVLSGGHGSMLYSSHLERSTCRSPSCTSRQLHSKTPGHPENTLTVGVDHDRRLVSASPTRSGWRSLSATSPLSTTAVSTGSPITTPTPCGDGDLQEGISYEACSFAGHQGLGKLILLYDDNRITIDGSTDLSWCEDVDARFEAMGWHAQSVDGHDREAIDAAIEQAKAETQRPSMIRCRTHIGHGSPNKQDTAAAHGAPLGEEEIRLTKAAIGWAPTQSFVVPDEAYAGFAPLRARGATKRAEWEAAFAAYQADHPELAAQWTAVHDDDGLPSDLEASLRGAVEGTMATRKPRVLR